MGLLCNIIENPTVDIIHLLHSLILPAATLCSQALSMCEHEITVGLEFLVVGNLAYHMGGGRGETTQS